METDVAVHDGESLTPDSGLPISMHPNGVAGGSPSPESPTKSQLREEIQQLKEGHANTMQTAQEAIAAQQDRAKRALQHQDAQFKQAAEKV